MYGCTPLIVMKEYVITNYKIGIEENIYLNDVWKKFTVHTEQINSEDVWFHICMKNLASRYYGTYHNKLESVDSHILANNADIVTLDSKWQTGHVLNMETAAGMALIIQQVFYTHAIQRRIIQFHSSLIDMQGRGLMFIGPSGIGKTTQAELWNRYRDALIINGDIVFVQETEGGFLGWGTPWHGSSPYCENASVPVEALIVLKQAPENSIRELTGFEKVTAVSNNVFYPRWLENGMELCLDVLDHLLCALPVYELSCRPDEEAVALTEKTIFGENRKW